MKRFVIVKFEDNDRELVVITERGQVKTAPFSGYKSGISIEHKLITKKIRRKIKTYPLHNLIIDDSEITTTEFPSGYKLIEQRMLPPFEKTLVYATEDEQVIGYDPTNA
jgi:glutamate synthase domain-containing protein 1